MGILLALAMAFLAVRLLETRRDLRAAQGELGFAARTAALGTLTAHLLHGLRNPVMGLHHVVANRSPQMVEESDWLVAAESTRRMKAVWTRKNPDGSWFCGERVSDTTPKECITPLTVD